MISWLDFKILGIFWFCLSRKIKWRLRIKGEKRIGEMADKGTVKPNGPSPGPGPAWWEEINNSRRLSSDFHTHEHTNTQINK